LKAKEEELALQPLHYWSMHPAYKDESDTQSSSNSKKKKKKMKVMD
jgi:hypothetical protein